MILLFVVGRRFGFIGGSSSTGSDSSSSSGGLLPWIPCRGIPVRLVNGLLDLVARAARSTFVLAGLAGIAIVLSFRFGLIQSTPLIRIGGVAVVHGRDAVSPPVGVDSGLVQWVVIGLAGVMGLEIVSPSSIVPQVGEGLGTLLPIVGLVLTFMLYKASQSLGKPDEVNRFVISADEEGGD